MYRIREHEVIFVKVSAVSIVCNNLREYSMNLLVNPDKHKSESRKE